jgi:hypothetical protein
MDIDIKTVIIVFVVLFVLYKLCGKGENFEPEFDPNDYLVTKCIHPGGCAKKMYEPKFGPKEFVYVKQPYKMNKNEEKCNKIMIIDNTPFERNIATHRGGEHGPRNTGFSPKYHGMKPYQYTPGYPNVTDDWNSLEVMPNEIIADARHNSRLAYDIQDPVLVSQ